MTDEEYLGCTERMRIFLREYNAPERHSAFRLYETIAGAFTSIRSERILDYPKDYWAMSSFTGKLRYIAMRTLLPCYKLVYPLFSIMRMLTAHRKT